MRNPVIFTFLLNSFLLINVLAQEMPLVYDVENTCADCPLPYLPEFNELPDIENLPDPFEWSDGRGRISNFSDWRYRRVEIGAEIQHYEIGEKPTRPDTITASYINDVLTVDITKNGETLTLTSAIILPDGEGPFPAMININSSFLSDTLFNRGIAIIPFNFSQVMAWQQTRGSEPINKLYPDLTYMGAYSAWSWGVSRLIDGLELVQDDHNIDLQHLGISGCSFAGKMALFAGAFDERIALTIAQESGGGGYTTWRYSEEITESVETLGNTSHVWFIEDLFQFSSDVPKLPYDHHELMAMVAPRALFATGNPGWTWLADESGYVGSNAAKKVYDALGVPDRLGYSQIGPHDHCFVIPDSQILEIQAFMDKFLRGIDTVNTDVATSPYTTDLTPWITWDTPILSSDTSYFGKTSLIYPANLEKGVDTALTFMWNKIEDADKYSFQLSTNATFTNIVTSDSTTDTVKTVTDLIQGTRYYWRVQVKNIDGSAGPWSGPSSFLTYTPLPSTPQLISATQYPNRTDYFRFIWKKADYADKYKIQVSRLLTFSPLAASATIPDTAVNLRNLNEGQKYYWRVMAENIGGPGSWSDTPDFRVIFAPTDLAAQISGLNEITLTWDDHSNIEDGFVMERMQSPQTTFSVLDTIAGNGQEYTDQDIENVQTYTYRIKAYKDSASSEYSDEVSILVTAIRDQQEIPTRYSLGQNYPNPFNPSTKIEFALPQKGLTKITVFDLLGRKIVTLINKEFQAGYHEITFDADNLPSGIYVYKIQSGDFTQAKKMILMK